MTDLPVTGVVEAVFADLVVLRTSDASVISEGTFA